MAAIRWAAVVASIALAVPAAVADPAGGGFAETSAKAKQTYDAARTELLARGTKAKTAAAAGDFAAWKPVNEAYMKQLADMTAMCEQNVAALTSAPDVVKFEAKSIATSFGQYADVGSSMFKARLQLTAYENLAERFSAADRVAVLKALAPLYLAE